MASKTGFGTAQFNSRTPAWVKRAVIIFHILLGSLSTWVYATELVPDKYKKEILMATGAMGTLITAVAPFFGIKTGDNNHDGDATTAD